MAAAPPRLGRAVSLIRKLCSCASELIAASNNAPTGFTFIRMRKFTFQEPPAASVAIQRNHLAGGTLAVSQRTVEVEMPAAPGVKDTSVRKYASSFIGALWIDTRGPINSETSRKTVKSRIHEPSQ